MSITRIHSGGPYEDKIGYCRAVVAGGFVHISGTVGQGTTVVDQCQSALETIEMALHQAGSDLTHVVRVRYILPDRDEFSQCWPMLRETFGANPPAATMIQAGLITADKRIEIEVTAAVGK